MIISYGGGFNLLWVIDPFVILLKAMNLQNANTYNIWQFHGIHVSLKPVHGFLIQNSSLGN